MEKVVASQIETIIKCYGVEIFANSIIAYEPIWAIGTGVTASIDDIRNMHIEIRKIIGPDIKILYGGSVNIKNAADILKVENVNGVLVGGASLDMVDFAFIAKAAG